MRVLLAVDGSEHSYEAARALARLKPPEHAVILHVIDVPIPMYPVMMPEVGQELSVALEREMREEAKQLLNRVQSLLPDDWPPVTERMETGKAAELILSVAEEEAIDMIVVGARGLSPIQELTIGSVSHRVTVHAPCPTLIINRPLPVLRHILVAVEGREDGEPVVQFLTRTPFEGSVDVTVISVVDEPLIHRAFLKSDHQRVVEKVLEHRQHDADEVAKRLAASGYRATALVEPGSPAVKILDEARKISADLIVVASRSRPALTRLFLGSVSHAVLHRAPCPSLVIRT